jgi:hypothetical protein
MRCMAEGTATSSKLLGWVVVAAMVSGAPLGFAQQVGVVPTNPYGPPACTAGAQPPVRSDDANLAKTEQRDALQNSRILLSTDPLPNFGVERYKLLEYGDCTGDSGCYWADLDAQYRRAETELDKQLATKKPGDKLAVVMDIDETTLTNYCEMRRDAFGYIARIFNQWEVSPQASMAIPGALRLFTKAHAAGVAVFFITGRPGIPDYSATPKQPDQAAPDPIGPHPTDADQTEATAKNLEAAGFHGWEGLALRNGSERTMGTIEYKSEERRRIVQKGYRILMSLGDQWSDLLGDPQADLNIKLPNPFYFIP